jgi:hypothetical protein
MEDKIQQDNVSESLSAKVKNWVEQQGYSLEMRVAKKFQENGFAVSQFEHFIDQESHSVRPVDVVATLSQDFGSSRVVIKLFIECKYSSKDKPWVIIATSEKFDKYAFFSRILKGQHPSNWANIDNIQGKLTAKLIQSSEKAGSLDSFTIKNPGYVVAESFKSQGDHAYEAIMQISKCVEAHDSEEEDTYKKTIQLWDQVDDQIQLSQMGLFISIAFPVVVINGQLFESYLAENNTVQVSEIESGAVFVPYRHRENDPNAKIILSPVTVVTEKFLERYVVSIKEAFENFLAQTKAIQEVIHLEKSHIVNPQQDTDF